MTPGQVARNQSGETTPAGSVEDTTDRKSLSQIAQEEFGKEFHGEVQPDPAPGAATDAPTGTEDDPQKPDAAAEDVDAAGEDTGEEKTGDETTDAENQGDKGKDADEGDDITTVNELVQQLEADPSWFQGLQVDVAVNGQTSSVPLRDLVAQYQKNQAADERLARSKTRDAEAQEQHAQQTAALEAQFQTAGAVLIEAEKVLNADMEQIDWNSLHEEDPGRWSAEKLKYQQRHDQLGKLKAHLMGQYQHQAQQTQNANTEKRQVFLQEQYQLLVQNMPTVSPDWGNPETAPAARSRLTEYLLDAGFSEDDVMNAADHRLLLIAEKARLHDEAKKKLNVTKKRIRKVPKVMKPGAPKAASQRNLDQQTALRGRLRTTGKLDDAVALLRAKRKG